MSRITVRFKISTRAYAKRFGIDLPDDSMDATLTGRIDVKDSIESVVEDAKINYATRASGYDPSSGSSMGGQRKPCKTPIEECSAKNPMTCRYHGARIIAEDIESIFRKNGLKGNVAVKLEDVSIDSSTGEESMTCTASIEAKDSDLPAVKKALEEFYALPGVTGDSDDVEIEGDDAKSTFEIDMLNPDATTRWGSRKGQGTHVKEEPKEEDTNKGKSKEEGKKKTPPKEDTATGNSNAEEEEENKDDEFDFEEDDGDDDEYLTPSVLPASPNKPTFKENDLKFLKDVSKRIGKCIRHINNNVIAGTTWGDKNNHFDRIDKNKLEEMAAKDPSVTTLVDWYNSIKESKDTGYTTPVLMDKFDKDADCNPDWYPGKQKKGFLDMSDFQFDFSKYEQEIKAYEDYKKALGETAEAKRDKDLTGYESLSKSKEKNAPVKLVQECLEAHREMTNLEKAYAEALKFPPFIRDMMAKKLAKQYYKANHRYEDAVKAAKDKVKKFLNSLMVMRGSIAETIEGFKERGEPVPKTLVNYQDYIDMKKDAAWGRVKSVYGFSDSQRATVEANWKKNVAALYNKATIANLTRDISWLFQYGTNVCTSGFYSITSANMGYRAHGNPDINTIAFCRATSTSPENYPCWWHRAQYSSCGGYALIIDNKKTVASFVPTLYMGASMWAGSNSYSNTSLATDSSLTSVFACGSSGYHNNPLKDVFLRDMSEETISTLLSAVCPGNDRGLFGLNEVYAHNGVGWHNLKAIKIYGDARYAFTTQQRDELQRRKIRVILSNGKDWNYQF